MSYFEHSRTPSMDELESNDLSLAWQNAIQSGKECIDLSVSNPTIVGLPSIQIDQAVLLSAVQAKYQASPQGLIETRQAISDFYRSENSAVVDPQNIQLFASTSEAVGALMKLLCRPGDEVITCTPTYPLLDCLTSLECVDLCEVPLQDCAGEWALDFWALENHCHEKTRAIIVVSPNNPTGHCIRCDELKQLSQFCAERSIVLIVDEVFSSYCFHTNPDLVSQPAANHCYEGLVISLSGLSKVCGLPQHKLGWAVFGGKPEIVSEAMERLQFITDSTLSVSGWVQRMAPYFLLHRSEFVSPCMERMKQNLNILKELASKEETIWTLQHVDGGWSACIRLPGWMDDEKVAVSMAEQGIRVFPGVFFGYRQNQPTLVVSLLPEPEQFKAGIHRFCEIMNDLL